MLILDHRTWCLIEEVLSHCLVKLATVQHFRAQVICVFKGFDIDLHWASTRLANAPLQTVNILGYWAGQCAITGKLVIQVKCWHDTSSNIGHQNFPYCKIW